MLIISIILGQEQIRFEKALHLLLCVFVLSSQLKVCLNNQKVLNLIEIFKAFIGLIKKKKMEIYLISLSLL